jgi:hypothetical protein
MVFFEETYVFLQLTWKGLLELTEPISTFKYLSCSTYSFLKLTQFSLGNKVLDGNASNIGVFLRDIHVSIQLIWIGLFGTKWSFLHLETCDLQAVFLSKSNSTLTGKQCARCSCIQHRQFSLRDTCVSSTHLNVLIWTKMSLSSLWTLCFAGNVPFRN